MTFFTLTGGFCRMKIKMLVSFMFIFTFITILGVSTHAQDVQEQKYQLLYDSIIIPAAPVAEPFPFADDGAISIHRVLAKLCDDRAIRLSLYAGDNLVGSNDVTDINRCFERNYEYETVGPQFVTFTFVVDYRSRKKFCEAVANTGVCNLWNIYIPHTEKGLVNLVVPTPTQSSGE